MSTLAKLTDLNDGDELITSDFEKRYLNTWMLFNGEVVYYIGRDGSNYHFKREDGKSIIWDTKKQPVVDLQVFLPKIGYYNVGDQVYYLYKQPQRQWKRSCSTSIYAHAPRVALFTPNRDATWKALLKATLNPSYLKLDKYDNNNCIEVALNRNFAIRYVNNRLQLFYKLYSVATVDIKNKVIAMTQNSMKQEVMDLFKYTGVTTWKLM